MIVDVQIQNNKCHVSHLYKIDDLLSSDVFHLKPTIHPSENTNNKQAKIVNEKTTRQFFVQY